MASKSEPALTELRDARIRRVDAVKGPANAQRFLIAKSSAGLVDAAVVAELAADDDPTAPDVYLDAGGTPIAKAEREFSDAERSKLADKGQAMPDGSYPIPDKDALERAIASYGRAKDPAAVKQHIIERARALGATDQLPEDWTAVQKERAMDPTTPTGQGKAPDAAVLKAAKAALHAAKVAKKARSATLAKANTVLGARALLAGKVKKNSTVDDLGEAHAALLAAIEDETDEGDTEAVKQYTALAAEVASAMTDEAAEAPGEEGDDDGEAGDDADEKADDAGEAGEVEKAKAAPVDLRKARKILKAARRQAKLVKYQRAIQKANAKLAKAGARTSGADQQHIDAADDHLGALGATFHSGPAHPVTKGGPAAVPVSKEAEAQVDRVLNLMADTLGPMFAQERDAMKAELTPIREQLAKVASTPLPGGPRVILDRDGAMIPATGDGQPGMSFEQATLRKAAEKYPIGSPQREALEKAAATDAISELMARQNGSR